MCDENNHTSLCSVCGPQSCKCKSHFSNVSNNGRCVCVSVCFCYSPFEWSGRGRAELAERYYCCLLHIYLPQNHYSIILHRSKAENNTSGTTGVCRPIKWVRRLEKQICDCRVPSSRIWTNGKILAEAHGYINCLNPAVVSMLCSYCQFALVNKNFMRCSLFCQTAQTLLKWCTEKVFSFSCIKDLQFCPPVGLKTYTFWFFGPKTIKIHWDITGEARMRHYLRVKRLASVFAGVHN